MNLLTLFDESFEQVDALVELHDALVTTNVRAVRPEWSTRFFGARLVNWPRNGGIWRSHAHSLLVVGRGGTALSHNSFSAERLSVFLRSAVVLAMAAVDKVLHEAISANFMELVTGNYFRGRIDLSVAESYEVALHARVRRGPGGRQRTRPGHEIKRHVMARVYEKSYLKTRHLEELAAALGKNSVFRRFGATVTPTMSSDRVKLEWSRLYQRRNTIAHEADVIRQVKAQRVHFHEVRPGDTRRDIAFIKTFGRFLARELPS